MPLDHAPSDAPYPKPGLQEPEAGFGIPMGRIGSLRLMLSYTIFFAIGILILVVLHVSRQPGNADLPRAALWGTLFWVSGWLLQAIVYNSVAWMLGRRMGSLTIGLLGVETTPVRWPARNSLIVSVATLTGLLVLGGFYRLVEGGFQVPIVAQPSESFWKLPSLGTTGLDSIWQTAAWLCFIQAIGQMYPLPRSLGRQIFASLASMCGGKMGVMSKVTLFRRCLDAVAVSTMLFAVWLMLSKQNVWDAEWPVFLVLSLLLWISTRNSDTYTVIDGFRAEEELEPDGDVIQEVREAVRRQRGRRRLKRAHRMEQGEAVDADRLDEILNRLHREGLESLNAADRRILERVSQNLRRQRDNELPRHDADG